MNQRHLGVLILNLIRAELKWVFDIVVYLNKFRKII
jgi:hypothetical protein